METKKLRDFETEKPRNQYTSKPRNKKTRNQAPLKQVRESPPRNKKTRRLSGAGVGVGMLRGT